MEPRCLTIDKGNSSTKMVLWTGKEITSVTTVSPAEELTLAEAEGLEGVSRGMVCSVAGDVTELCAAFARKGIQLQPLTHSTPIPLVIDYATPDSLGLDRIAAAVGARSLFPGAEVLIVDLGTAITYDRITPDGHYVGGNIAPGVGMRLRSLHAFTSALPTINSRGEVRLWGDTTETAMRSGAINGVVAEIGYYRRHISPDAVVAITGGWGPDIASRLDFDYALCPNLVNRGLRVCLLNENITDK